METLKAWHFVGHTLRDGRPVPPDGEWLEHDGPIAVCQSGFHFSERISNALDYAPGLTLCRVEVDGVWQNDPLGKGVARRRRILWRIPAKKMHPIVVRFAWACAWRVDTLSGKINKCWAEWSRDAASEAGRAWLAGCVVDHVSIAASYGRGMLFDSRRDPERAYQESLLIAAVNQWRAAHANA